MFRIHLPIITIEENPADSPAEAKKKRAIAAALTAMLHANPRKTRRKMKAAAKYAWDKMMKEPICPVEC